MNRLLAARIAWANARRTIHNSVLPLKGLSADEAEHVDELKQWVDENRRIKHTRITDMCYGSSWVDSDGLTWRKDRWGTKQYGGNDVTT